MKQPLCSAAFFIATVSLLLFSGQQQRRPVTSPQQRQAALPKTAATSVPDPVLPAVEMPSLFWLPEDIKYPEMPPGSPRTMTLLGDPKTEGLYVTRTLIPKGKKIIPHTHSDARTVIVLSGTYLYGLGEEFDESRMVALPPGSFFTESARVPHFTWAKESEVIVQTTAVGPSGTQIIPEKNPTPAK